MNVNSIKINNVYHNGEVDFDGLLPEVVEGLDVIKGLNENKEILGAKNLLPLTLDNIKSRNTIGQWSGNAYTRNGVTFTVNTDSLGSVTDITVNGSASADIQFSLTGTITNNFIGCRFTGSPVTSQNLFMVANYMEGTTWKDQQVCRNGEEIIINQIYPLVYIVIYIGEGESFINKVFTPMIRLATDPNPTYRPYAMSNQELTQRLLSLEQRVAALEG